MLEEEISTRRGPTPNHWWSNNGASSEPAAHHPAIHAGIPGGVNNSPWHMRLSTALLQPSLACRPSSMLPWQLRPCQKRHISALAPAHSAAGTGHLLLSKKRRRIEHTYIFPCWVRELNLLMEGLVKPQGQDKV